VKYWFDSIKKPIIALAPMHGFTNSELRRKCRQAGADAVYSEMIAAEAIIRRIPKAFEMMTFEEGERPIVIQIFGANPASMAQAAEIIEKEIKPDGIDINFGCPVQKAAKQEFGSYQLRRPQKAAEIVRAVANATSLPVSVTKSECP
jgi:tRNA-dihydrouridine synthase B